MKNKNHLLIALVVFILLIFGIFIYNTSKKEQDVIKIGYIGPMTGPVSITGLENLKGIEMAIDETNDLGGIHGKKILLVKEDDQFDTKNTVTSFNKLVNFDGIDIIFSPTYSGILSLGHVADEKKVLLINPFDATGEIASAGEYVFGIGIYAEGHGQTFSKFIYENLDKKEAAIIYNNDESFVTLIRNSFVEDFESRGGDVIYEDTFSFSTKDFRTIILKLQEKGIKTIVLIGWDESGFFIKQAEELNADLEIIGLATFTSEGFIKNAGDHSQKIYYLGWDSESQEYKQIVEKYTSYYGRTPHQPLFVAVGYDATNFVLAAMKMDGNLKDNLYSIKDFQGLTGTLTMSEDGIVRTITAQNSVFGLDDQFLYN